MSFLEMLDVVNEGLIEKGEEPIAFDHDCREGICGTCGVVINGRAHGPRSRPRPVSSTCAASRTATLTIEPWRARAFPVVKDLVVDRSAFDRIIAGRRLHLRADRRAPDGNTIPVPKENSDLAMDAAACIGCGACVAACPTPRPCSSPRRKVVAPRDAAAGPARAPHRVLAMVAQMDAEGFGTCTNHGSARRSAQGDPHGVHRADERGLAEGVGRPRGRGAGRASARAEAGLG
jgi:succinate dehydrogenase / fumarate reductase iron-sulfur subunit